MSPAPILIIGQGLAGTALAWRLWERGAPFLIVDRQETVTASKVAGGLVTPITGMRLSLSWRCESLYPQALAFYRRRERQLGGRYFRPVPVVRLLRDPKDAAHWVRRMAQPEVRRFIRPAPEGVGLDEAVFANPHGAFQQRHAGWLDTAAYLEASRAFFAAQGCWRAGQVMPQDLTLGGAGVTWQGGGYSTAVFCTGWEAARVPWFGWVPFQSARGTVLTLAADTGGERRVISRGTWLLPQAGGGLRAGSTYEWDFSDPHTPSPAAAAGLEDQVRRILKVPFQVTASQTAVRPIIKGREALLGRHPAHPQIAFLNGLGSKGVLRAPWLAHHLTAHLLDGEPIEAELDLAGNL